MGRIPKAAQPADAATMIGSHDNRLRQVEHRLTGDPNASIPTNAHYYGSFSPGTNWDTTGSGFSLGGPQPCGIASGSYVRWQAACVDAGAPTPQATAWDAEVYFDPDELNAGGVAGERAVLYISAGLFSDTRLAAGGEPSIYSFRFPVTVDQQASSVEIDPIAATGLFGGGPHLQFEVVRPPGGFGSAGLIRFAFATPVISELWPLAPPA